MKKIFLSAILFCLSIIMIISGLVLNIFSDYKDDKSTTLAYVESIDKYYNSIKINLENAHSYMASMNTFFGLYYEEANTEKDKYNSVMEEIATIKLDIDSDYNNVVEICQVELSNLDSDECSGIVDSYSSFINTYNSLLKNYNNFLKQCDSWNNI